MSGAPAGTIKTAIAHAGSVALAFWPSDVLLDFATHRICRVRF
jgi:hypothetical protein